MPCLFMNEGLSVEVCRFRTVTHTRIVNREVVFDHVPDPDVPSLENSLIYVNRLALDVPQNFEFSPSHWTRNDFDICRMLLRNMRPRRRRRFGVCPILASTRNAGTHLIAKLPEKITEAAAKPGIRKGGWSSPLRVQRSLRRSVSLPINERVREAIVHPQFEPRCPKRHHKGYL